MKIQWKKTEWDDFLFWKKDVLRYRRKRWLLCVFGFGLGYWLGMNTTYSAVCACLGLAVASFIGTIVDMIGESRFKNRTEDDLIAEATREADEELAKNSTSQQNRPSEDESEEEQEDVVLLDQSFFDEEDK